jgi:hypothetical protein
MSNTSRAESSKTPRRSSPMQRFIDHDLWKQPWAHVHLSSADLATAPTMSAQAPKSQAPATGRSWSQNASDGSVQSQKAKAPENRPNKHHELLTPVGTMLCTADTCSGKEAAIVHRSLRGKIQETGDRNLLRGIRQQKVPKQDMIQDLTGVGTMFGK